MMNTARNADLIDKMNSSDKDFRFMAVNDLIDNISNKSIGMDDQLEKAVIETLLKMLNDQNAEVQNLVVRCLGLCVSNVGDARLKTMVDDLCKAMDDKAEKIRDAASMAMGHAVKQFQSEKNIRFASLVDLVMPKFVALLQANRDVNVVDRVLEMLSEIFRKSSSKTEWGYKDLTKVMFLHAESDRVGIRKRAQSAISLYADVVDTQLFNEVLKTVYEACEKYQEDNGRLKTYIATAAAICKNSGPRFARDLPQFAQLFINICERNTDDEVREAAVGAFETFFQKCPEAVDQFSKPITGIVIDLLSYDPNYSYDDSDNEDAMDVDVQNGVDSDEDDVSDYSDDEDVSWKVRRAAAKCIRAIIASRTDNLYENYVNFGELLIRRLKEREDNVKQDVINAYMTLLGQTRMLVPETVVPYTFGDFNYEGETYSFDHFVKFIRDDSNAERKQVFEVLQNQIPLLINRICKVQKAKELPIVVPTFVLLGTLLKAYPGCIGSSIPVLSKGIKATLNKPDGNLKTPTLRFLSMFFATHPFEEYGHDIASILDDIILLASDSFSKVASESIDAINFLIRSMVASSNPDQKMIETIYNMLVKKLQVSDMDQEVKDKTVMGAAYIISGFGDELGPSLESTLRVLCARLSNEMSRNVTLKALTIIVDSGKRFNIQPIVPIIVSYFATFMRKNNRTLRIHTLTLALSLAGRTREGGLISVNLTDIVDGLPPLLHDSDLQIAQLALRFMTSLMVINATMLGNITPFIVKAVELSKSSLVQGACQKALCEFFASFVKSKYETNVTAIVAQFMAIVTQNTGLHRNAFVTIAKCIAHVALAAGDVRGSVELSKELYKCVTHGQSDAVNQLGVLALGELGRFFPGVYNQPESVDPANLIINCFCSHTSEDVKMMASQALGSLAVGNIQKFLPFILNQIEGQPTRQYLLIFALKELITSETVDEAGQQLFIEKIDSVWDVLIRHAGAAEESTRAIVAECLGKLAMMNPGKYLGALSNLFQLNEPKLRSTALVAVRYMIQDQPNAADAYLANTLDVFLQKGIVDADIETRRLAIVLLNTAAHYKPGLIRSVLESLLPLIYAETDVRKELQHEVEMGPFKHLVDDGLELRKSAFECLYSLVEHCLGHLQLNEFITCLEKGLNDQHEIKQLAYLTIIRLSEICPLQLSQHADTIADIMKTHLMMKPKQNAVKLENDKQEEIKRSVIKALLAIKKMQVHERSLKIKEAYDLVCGEEYATILNEVRSEVNACVNL